MRSILIVEDHEKTAQWWLDNINRVFPNADVDTAVTMAEAMKRVRKRIYSLALVDLNLPDGSGLDIIRFLAATRPETCVVVSTIFDDDHHVFSALRAGASGYLIKDQPWDKQLAMLADLVNGIPPVSPGIARRILRYFAEERAGALEDSHSLSEREKEVLVYIAKGYNRPETARLMGLTKNTIASYTKSIYRKLNVSTRAEAVSEAIRMGLVSED